jgi:hypothetical protein
MPDAMNLFVGSMASLLSLGAAAAAFDLWQQPFQLTASKAIERLWGHAIARCCFGLVAVLLGFAAGCIFIDIRPPFSAPVRAVAPPPAS